jgi:hypothetical protein
MGIINSCIYKKSLGTFVVRDVETRDFRFKTSPFIRSIHLINQNHNFDTHFSTEIQNISSYYTSVLLAFANDSNGIRINNEEDVQYNIIKTNIDKHIYNYSHILC